MGNTVTEGIAKLNKLGGIEHICKLLHTSPDEGISDIASEENARRHVYGTNKIDLKRRHSIWKMIWSSLKDITMSFLLVIVFVSCILQYRKGGNGMESISLLISVVTVVFVTVLNDYLKEQRFCDIHNEIEKEHVFNVIRDGEVRNILVNDIVVGDICQIKYGNMVPADGLLIHSYDLEVDASAIGKQRYAKKKINFDPFILTGSYVLHGRGKMVVTAVGLNSQACIRFLKVNKRDGQTNAESSNRYCRQTNIQNEKDDYHMYNSALQTKLTHFAYHCGLFGLVMGVITFAILVTEFSVKTFVYEKSPWIGEFTYRYLHIFITGVAMMVVACPEGLPLAITLSLAHAVKQMHSEKILVRHMDACETMAYVTSVCTNKTGALTKNRTEVVQAYICHRHWKQTPDQSDIPERVLNLIVLCISVNSAYTARIIHATDLAESQQIGNRTDCALLLFVEQIGKSCIELRRLYPEEIFRRVYTFNSYRRMMCTIVPIAANGYRLLCKGAADELIHHCSFIYGANGVLESLNDRKREQIIKDTITMMACEGLRTILCAYRDFVPSDAAVNDEYITEEPNWKDRNNIVSKMTFLCVFGILDPIQPEVLEGIQQLHDAGITVRVITGDSIHLACHVAMKCGIIQHDDKNAVLDGIEFNRRIHDNNGDIQQHLLDEVWPNLRVLGRSTPADKSTLVSGIQNSKLHVHPEIVAVVGHSANDGAVLKGADIGIALGRCGTDVAKDSSDIILIDDRFKSILRSALWGRNIHENISKFLQFQIIVNLVVIITSFVSICILNELLMNVFEMLYSSVLLNIMASLALGSDTPKPKLVFHRPYRRTRPLITRIMMKNIIGHTAYQCIVLFVVVFCGATLFDFDYGIGKKKSTHNTFIFTVFVMMTLFNELNVRKVHGEKDVFDDILKNPIFYIIWMGTVVVQVVIVQTDQILIPTEKMDMEYWMWSVFFGVGTLVWAQVINALPNCKLRTHDTWSYETARASTCFKWFKSVGQMRSQSQRIRRSRHF